MTIRKHDDMMPYWSKVLKMVERRGVAGVSDVIPITKKSRDLAVAVLNELVEAHYLIHLKSGGFVIDQPQKKLRDDDNKDFFAIE